MSNYVPQDKIDEIRGSTDIVQIVSDHVSLKKRGQNYIGLCPFHSEKTPSFTVSAEKQIFHCFGCGKGGNAFTFLMEYNNLSFPETIRSLAEKAGIALPRYKKKGEGSKEDNLLSSIFTANRTAMEFYHHQLMHSPSAVIARDYLKKRGIGEETAREFKVGYADRGGQSLIKALKGKGVSSEVAGKAGLIISREGKSKPLDRFRGRLLFPIMDVNGRCLGFGGRVFGDDMPKYLNSPETPVFKKGATLYGLNFSRTFIQREGYMLIVEGYFDLLALYQAGIKNVVATLGTALTERHVRRLARYSKIFYTLFDSDEAGVKAAMRSLPIFLKEEAQSRVVLLPKGKDPDQIIAEDGREKMVDLIGNSQPLMEFYVDKLSQRFDLDDPYGKLSFVEETLPIIRVVKNPLERGIYIKKVSEMSGIAEGLIASKARGQSRTKGVVREKREEVTILGRSLEKAEENILKIFLNQPELYCEEYKGFSDEFEDEILKRLGKIWEESIYDGKILTLSALIDSVDDDTLKTRLSRLLLSEDELLHSNIKEVLKDCWNRVKLNSIKKAKKVLDLKIREAEAAGEDETWKALLKKQQELRQSERLFKAS
ncbi:MAG: DNA primase [Thermodesulfobacteriota bacterium]